MIQHKGIIYLKTPFKTLRETLDAFYNEEHNFIDEQGRDIKPRLLPVGFQIRFEGKKLNFLHRVTRTYKLSCLT